MALPYQFANYTQRQLERMCKTFYAHGLENTSLEISYYEGFIRELNYFILKPNNIKEIK